TVAVRDTRLPEERPRVVRALGTGRGDTDADVLGDRGDHAVCRHGEVLGVRAAAFVEPEDPVPDVKCGHGRAACLHDAGELGAQDTPFWAEQTSEYAH